MSHQIVDTQTLVCDLIKVIQEAPIQPPIVFIDIEGIDVSRFGSIAIMQVLVPPSNQVYLVDVHTLQSLAFSTPSTEGVTLKDILESQQIPKVFFDVRNDSDALFSHFHIDLGAIIDLQLLEFATRSIRGRFVKGLSKCMSESKVVSWADINTWDETKAAGRKLFAPELGGRYEVFLERPIPLDIIKYCTQDVLYMPKLLMHYTRRLNAYLARQIEKWTDDRLSLSQSPRFDGRGKHMAIGPNFLGDRFAATLTVRFPMDLICSPDISRHCVLIEAEDVKVNVSSQCATTAISDSTATISKSGEPMQSTETRATSPLEESDIVVARYSEGISTPSNGEDIQIYDEENYGTNSNSDADYHESPKDYTACSADDCGYCGRCMY